MRKLVVVLEDKKYLFTLYQENDVQQILLNFEELSAFDTIITVLQKSGGFVKDPIISPQSFTVDIEKLFKKVAELFPENKPEKEEPKQIDYRGHML